MPHPVCSDHSLERRPRRQVCTPRLREHRPHARPLSGSWHLAAGYHRECGDLAAAQVCPGARRVITEVRDGHCWPVDRTGPSSGPQSGGAVWDSYMQQRPAGSHPSWPMDSTTHPSCNFVSPRQLPFSVPLQMRRPTTRTPPGRTWPHWNGVGWP